ncbi:hypothetical protein [Bacillus sp. T33-2]|uniref:hypothetical protein n=1 Tax=Bacillus sp. T33-2 TaxID=2054168 RepID=UPI0015E10708|nr:hypothetical protein [Bacillus sp. T33-2]
MKKQNVVILSLNDISRIVAEHLAEKENTRFYSGIRVCHDANGVIFFKFQDN